MKLFLFKTNYTAAYLLTDLGEVMSLEGVLKYVLKLLLFFAEFFFFNFIFLLDMV